MVFNSVNSFNFGQPITQTQSAYGDGGANQNLNLAYNINTTPPTPQNPYPQVTQKPPVISGYGNQPPVVGTPYTPQGQSPIIIQPQPSYSRPSFYPYYYPLPIPRKAPVPPRGGNKGGDTNNIITLLLNMINNNSQSQSQSQSQGGGMGDIFSLLLLIKLFTGDDEAAPEPARPERPERPARPPRKEDPPRRERKAVTGGDTTKFKERAKVIQKKGSPLTFDLDGNGIGTVAGKVSFDIDGDGKADAINDIAKGDGLLVFDADGDGVSGANGKEVLGDNTDVDGDGIADNYTDGFDALRALVEQAKADGADINDDNVLDADEIAILERDYGLKMKVGSINGEAISLSEAGVTSINLSTGAKTQVTDFDGQGNDVTRQDGATFTRTDGSTGDYEDIWFSF